MEKNYDFIFNTYYPTLTLFNLPKEFYNVP